MTPERFAKGMTFDEYVTWASIPVAVFFTKDVVELYRYVEYPAPAPFTSDW